MPTAVHKKGGRLKLPSNEQTIVDEFSGVIRRHQNEEAMTVARSMNIAFGISMGRNDSRQDKLAHAYFPSQKPGRFSRLVALGCSYFIANRSAEVKNGLFPGCD